MPTTKEWREWIEQAVRYKAIGEISTQYYDCPECPERISKTLPSSRLVLMLRHPVDRAYSHYGFCVQRANYRGSFTEFLMQKPKALEKGYYSRYVKRYLEYFNASQILALVAENVFVDIPGTQKKIADFLNIDLNKFSAINAKVNASTVPHHRSVYGLVVKTGRRLRRLHLEPLVDFVMRLGIQKILSNGNALPVLDKGLKKKLSLSYERDFEELEQCLQIDLRCWRE